MFQKTILFVSYPTSLPESVAEDLKDYLCQLGAAEVYFDEEIWMSAVGAQLDLLLPVGCCVMNIGYSHNDIAFIFNGKMMLKKSSGINGKYISDLLRQWFASEFNMAVSPADLDAVKRSLGTVRMNSDPLSMNVRGLDLGTRTLKTVTVSENQIAAVLAPFARALASWVQNFIQDVPEPYRRDIYERGIVTCGGTMNIKGLAKSLATMVDAPVYVTDDPSSTVVQGLEILMSRTAERKRNGKGKSVRQSDKG